MKKRYIALIAFLAILLVAAWLFKTILDIPGRAFDRAEKTAIRAGEVFVEFCNLRPRIIINDRIVSEQTRSIAEFAVVEREFTGNYVWTSRWLGSTKTIQIDSVYLAKAGFDLKDDFVVRIDPETGQVVADLPAPKLLSMERKGEIEYSDKSGWINRVTSEDRQLVFNEVEKAVRTQVEKSDLIEEARQQSLKRLQELADRNNQQMMFSFRLPEKQTPEPEETSEPKPGAM